ncbi:MAG: hypothetical protein OXS33_13180 [bacterium]|nr:hypothetical protein [bacterium]
MMGPTGQGLLDIDDPEVGGMIWDEIVAAADGERVNWFMWAGSEPPRLYRRARCAPQFLGVGLFELMV